MISKKFRSDRVSIEVFNKMLSLYSIDMYKTSIKNRLKEIIDNQPEDATYDEILRELAFERMVERGLNDSRNNRTISNEEMGHRIKRW